MAMVRAVLYEYSCTVILVPVQLYRLYLVLPNTCNLLHAEIPNTSLQSISLSTQHLQLGVRLERISRYSCTTGVYEYT